MPGSAPHPARFSGVRFSRQKRKTTKWPGSYSLSFSRASLDAVQPRNAIPLPNYPHKRRGLFVKPFHRSTLPGSRLRQTSNDSTPLSVTLQSKPRPQTNTRINSQLPAKRTRRNLYENAPKR